MALLSPDLPLPLCPELPTQHTLPRAAVERLEFALWRVRGTGRAARAQDIVGLLILFYLPEQPRRLVELLTRPHSALRSSVAELPTGRYRRALTKDSEQIMLRLPSPVTHRLNGLINSAHDLEFRTSRRHVVSAAALHCIPQSTKELADALDQYREAPARAARLPFESLDYILDPRPPNPGRRPML